MIHYFQTMDKHLDYYRWAIEGDRELAERYLHGLFVDVRYVNSKEEDPYAKGKKVLPNGLIVRDCRFSYTFKSQRNPNHLRTNTLPTDSRHKQLGGDGRGQTSSPAAGY